MGGTPRRFFLLLALALAIVAGIWLRTLPAGSLLAVGPLRGRGGTTVNLFFPDGPFLFPVSRRFQANDRLPRVVLEALLAGPRASGRLQKVIPPGIEVRSFSVVDGVARIDLSRDPGRGDEAQRALAAITATLTRIPGVRSVAVDVQGRPVVMAASRTPLLYFAAADGLVAVPTDAGDARAALAAYLSGPPAPGLTAVPSDVRLLKYDAASGGEVSLGFTYTPSMRALALEQPGRTRMLLLGVIATLTDFPVVNTVRIDFGGQSRLGLGECSDLLRSPQHRPALLNDERLLD
jgi:spore germination protein GerM